MRTIFTCFLLICVTGQLLAGAPHGLLAAPTAPAKSITFSSIDGDRMSVQWQKGDGLNRIVIARKGAPVTALPQDAVYYTADAKFTGGVEIEDGQFVVYNGSGSSFTLTGLTPNNTYHVAVFEYNGTGSGIEYLRINPAQNSHATLSAPTGQATLASVSEIIGHSMKVSWKKGNGSGRLVLAREGAAVNVNPIDLVNYTSNSSFGKGSQIGTGNFVVYEGSAESNTIDNLKPNTTYHFAVFEYSGNQGYVYATTNPPTASGSTLPRPTVPASNFTFSQVEGDRMRITVDKGNGVGRIIIAKKGSAVTAIPEDGKDYIGKTTFGDGYEIAPGEFVLSYGTSNDLTVTGLEKGQTYHFAVYEYDGSGTATAYFTAGVLTASKSTVSAPAKAAENISFSSSQSNAVTITWDKGDGAERLVVMRKTDPINGLPVDYKFYSGATTFGSGVAIGGGYSVYSGNGNTVTVAGLAGGTTYHVAIFEYNGKNQPVYLTSSYPTYSFTTAQAPSQAASNMQFSYVEGNRMKVSWNNGNGNRRVVIARAGSPVTFKPTDNESFIGNAAFGDGQLVAPGEYVVFNNTSGAEVSVTKLLPGITYHFAVYEYNAIGANNYYLVSSFLSGQRATLSAPTGNSSALTFPAVTGNSISLSWQKGNGNDRLILAKAGSPVDATPADFTDYAGNTDFGVGSQIGNGNYVVYDNSGNTTTVEKLLPGVTYYFKIFEYNGSSAPVYLTSGNVTGVQTTLERPSAGASAIKFEAIEGNKMTIKWTSGNGSKRLIIGREGLAVTYKPVDGETYTPNAALGAGQKVSEGEFVLYNSSTSDVTVTGLQPNKVYHFTIFEYDGTGANTRYLTSLVGTGQQATLSKPATQAKTVQFASIGSSSVNVNWTSGDGDGRVVIGRKGAPVDVTPQDLAFYSGNASFGTTSTKIGTDNYVVYRGAQSNVNVTNLIPGSTYYFAVFEYNGFTGPVYNMSPTAQSAVTTLGPPTDAATAIKFKSAGISTALTIEWANGTGQQRLVLVKEGSAVDAIPANNTAYIPNTFFGSGAQLGSGNFAVHSGTGNNVTITNLDAGKVYHIAIYEFNQFPTGPLYMQNDPARAEFAGFALPVRLVSFSGNINNGHVVLTWKTSSEINSREFVIERSVNGTDYSDIGKVAASGSSELVRTYTFEDKAPLATGYYRLRMVDEDGDFEMSKVIRLSQNGLGQTSLSLYPTRASSKVNLSIQSQAKERVSFEVFDVNGRLVKREQPDIMKGANLVMLDITNLPQGMYVVHAVIDGQVFNSRFIKE